MQAIASINKSFRMFSVLFLHYNCLVFNILIFSGDVCTKTLLLRLSYFKVTLTKKSSSSSEY